MANKYRALTKTEWSDLMDFLFLITADELESIETLLVQQGVCEKRFDPTTHHEDTRALGIYNAIVASGASISGVVVLIRGVENDVLINIKRIDEFRLGDAIKLVDMLYTNSFPTEITAHYRNSILPNSKDLISLREIMLSDELTFLRYRPDFGGWNLFSQPGERIIPEIDQVADALRSLNSIFVTARHVDVFSSASLDDNVGLN